MNGICALFHACEAVSAAVGRRYPRRLRVEAQVVRIKSRSGEGGTIMLITCPECGKRVSDKASACPNCGAPIEVIGASSELSDQKRSVAVVFAIFLGIVGGHNSYLGYKKRATIEFILGVIGFFTIHFIVGALLLFVLWIWGIVEALSYKTDGEGRLLR